MKLQEKNRKVYSWQYVGTSLGMSRQAAQSLFLNEPNEKSFIKYSTLAGIIAFFESEGMPVTISDLFTVNKTD